MMNEMKHILKKTVLICLVLVSIVVAACDKSKWRAKEYSGPPSWENDLGRPDGYGGENPWR
jgi:hypothetical protein